MMYFVELVKTLQKLHIAFNQPFAAITLITIGKHIAFVGFRLSSIPIAVLKAKFLVKANDGLRLYPCRLISRMVKI